MRWTEKEASRNSQLLVNHTAPHAPISRDTLSHWALGVLDLAGIKLKIRLVETSMEHIRRGERVHPRQRVRECQDGEIHLVLLVSMIN